MTRRRTRTALLVTGLLLSLAWPAVQSQSRLLPTASVNKTTAFNETNEIRIDLDTSSSPVENPKVEWRRTVNGWEPTSVWAESGISLTPAALTLHPAIVAILQVLISVGALLTFEYTDEDESDDLIHMLTQ